MAGAPAAAGRVLPQLPALTGLRFFAALQVVVYHFGLFDRWPLPRPVGQVAGAGFEAVTLFYVLSGFILTYTYMAPGVPRVSGPQMYAARLARVYPVYALALVVAAPGFLYASLLQGATPQAVTTMVLKGVAVVSCVQAYIPHWALAWNAPAWSISVELTFYALFPLLAPALLSCRRRTAVGVAVAGWLLSLVPTVVYLAVAPVEAGLVHPWRALVDYNPLIRLPTFVMGIVTGRLFLEALSAGVRPWRPGTLAGLGAVAAALVVGAEPLPKMLVHGPLLAPCFALVVFGLAWQEGGLARVLSWRPVVALGDASYSLYILHVPVFVWMAYAATRRGMEKPLENQSFILIGMVTVVVVSSLSHRLVEVPARQALRRRLTALARRVAGERS
jgi:peptidoglycan/LPS O-acetylase OafA/YrhL